MAYDTPYNAPADSGTMFAVKAKKHEKAPDYNGEIKVNLKDMTGIVQNSDGTITIKIGGWKATSKSGSTYLKLKVSRFVPREQAAKPAPAPSPFDDGSDVPF